ncbi:MAG: SpoIID/LytB domain-containing protein [Vicinamibacterales bacterium]
MSARAQTLAAIVLGVLVVGGIRLAPRLFAQADTLASQTVRIGVLRNGSYEVVTLPLETYVARVLTGEAAPQTPPSALQALAVAIRTYTATNRGRHRGEGFDLCDQTHCQVMRTATAATERAAQATAGQVLLYRGVPATVYYSASCGGRSEKPSNVWPGSDDPPYLSIHDDDACEGFPQWSAELALSDLQRALAAAGYHGRLRDVRIGSRNDSGRVARLTLEGMTPGTISGQDLRMVVGRTLGFQHIQSTTFELSRVSSRIRFRGRGAGHGVGMCVIGSMKLAAAGQSAAAILARYYPGTQIGAYGIRATGARPDSIPIDEPAVIAVGAPPDASDAVPPPAVSRAATPGADARAGDDLPRDVDVVLPPPDAADRSAVASAVVRARGQMAEALGVPAPAVRVRFHASTAAFERATQRPWFTLGAVVDGELQFVPIAALRARGVFDRMLRHQLARLMVDAELQDRAEWIREGAALYFSDPDAHSSVRGLCPTDAELQRPTSAGAFGEAASRARACFERRMGGNRDWKTIK